MKKIIASFILSLFVLSVFASAQSYSREDRLPTKIYSPLAKKNIPAHRLNKEMMEEILASNSPLLAKWNRPGDLKALAKHFKIDMSSLKAMPVVKGKRFVPTPKPRGRHTSAERRAESIYSDNEVRIWGFTKQSVANAFGIEEIYSPVYKRMVPIERISKKRFISYLNSPLSQRKTFGEGSEDRIDKKLEEMGIRDNQDTLDNIRQKTLVEWTKSKRNRRDREIVKRIYFE